MGHKEILETFDLDTQNLIDVVDGLLNAVIVAEYDRLAPILAWRVGFDLLETDNDAEKFLLGYRLTLDALRQHPDVVLAAVQSLYAKVDAIAPRLKVSPP